MKKTAVIFILLIMFFTQIYAIDIIWLSNTPPSKLREKFDYYGMRRLPYRQLENGDAIIYQWIRSGILPQSSAYVNHTNTDSPQLFVFSPEGAPVDGELVKNEWGYLVSYPGSQEGYFNIYLVEKFVTNDTLNILIAKAERLSHYCRNGHDKALLKAKPKIYADQIPVEIIRERFPRENFHTAIYPGSKVTFKILVENKPAVNGQVTLTTQKGWVKKLTSNKQGEVTFQFIQDDISRWQEMRRRRVFNYLLIFDQTVKKEGNYQDISYNYVRYIGTFSDSYRPSQIMYSSFVWALFVLLIVLILLSISVYLYRKRNKIEFKEIVINE